MKQEREKGKVKDAKSNALLKDRVKGEEVKG